MKQLVQTTDHRVHKHLPPTLMVKFLFRTPPKVYPVQPALLAKVTTDTHNHPTRDRVRRLPSIIIHSLPFQLYLHKPVHIPRAEIWTQVAQRCSASPVENTTIGGRIAPMIVIVTIVTVTHTPPTCVGHHQNLPLSTTRYLYLLW